MGSCVLLAAALSLGQTVPEAQLAPELGQKPVELPPPPPVAPPVASPSDRWLRMQMLQGTWMGSSLTDNRMQVSGWIDTSFTGSSAADSNSPMGFNYRANQFLLQQNWVRFERSVVTSGTEPTFGFHNDWILPGSDYVFTLPRGLFNSQLTANNGAPIRTGIDPVQFYLQGYFPTIGEGLDIKFGRFFAQYGVEQISAVDNYFLSHSYSDVYDPFTHTGLLITTKLTPAWAVQAGITLGSDNFIDPTDRATFIGNVNWAPPDGRDSLLFNVILGPARYNQERRFHNPDIFDLIYTHRFNPRMKYSLESLYGFTTNVPDMGFANWYGLIHYLGYDFTPRLTGATRLELFEDFQGQRTGFSGLYSALTVGVQFRLRREIIFRPELRYDYNYHSAPFEAKHGLFTATSDVILRW
jgi:hypothetical protein